MSKTHDPYAALRHADYRRLLAGNMLTGISNGMQSVAVGWELWNRTHDELYLGYVGLVQFVPVFLLALPAGQLADRFSRKLLLVSAQVTLGCASLGLAFLSAEHGPLELIFLCLLVAGISQAIMLPSRWALVPQIVPESALTNAITWNSSGWQVASVIGPALGGTIIGFTDKMYEAYLLAAVSSFTCAALVAPIRPRTVVRAKEPMTLGSLLAGVAFVWRSPLILATITLDMFAMLLGGVTALLPVFADKTILDVGPSGLGWLRAAPSVGAFLMALTQAHRPPMRHAGRTLMIAVAGFGAATIVFGLSRNFFLSFGMLMLTGAFDNISVVVRGTLLQLLTPDEMRGRVSAVNAVFISSSNQLGDFESGLTAWLVGPVWSVVGGGLGTWASVLLVMLAWPQVLRLGTLSQSGVRVKEKEPISSTEIPQGEG